MKQYLVICYQHELEGSFIVNDLKEFIKEYNYVDNEDDENEIQKNLDWLLSKDKSNHDVYEVINGELVLISQN